MEQPALRDSEEYPDDEVLRRHLGRTMAAWRALVTHVEEPDSDLVGEWRYYKDGKSWLYKVTCKKLTLAWVSVFRRRFTTTCYFPDRAKLAIMGSKLPKQYVDQYLEGRRYGKTRGITVEVRKLADLEVTKQVMEIRRQVK